MKKPKSLDTDQQYPTKKMKHILPLLFIIAILAIVLITTSALTSPTGFVIADSNENNAKELPSFKLYTKAVCENKTDFIVCQDELFASCGDVEYKIPKNNITGKGIFDKDWEDPRND